MDMTDMADSVHFIRNRQNGQNKRQKIIKMTHSVIYVMALAVISRFLNGL